MLKHIYLILIATFIFGLVTGIILRVINVTTDDTDYFQNNNTETLTISVHAYGGCESGGCPSYRMEDKGACTYIVRLRNAPEIRTTGKLKSEEWKAIEGLVNKTDFETLVESKFSGTCPITFDGLAFRYTITFDSKYYTFDSCTQELSGVDLFEILSRYFGVFQNWEKQA